MSKNNPISRKVFLGKISMLGLAGAGAGVLLKGCGNGEAVDPCGDLTGLSESDLQLRDALNYVAETPNPSERCDNCVYWVDDRYGEHCGGCTLFAGPVHPAGWCSSWVPE
jgi:hypothetical protein